MNYFSFHVGDYSAHTAHLDLMEDLAYRRMLDLYYRTEKPLPADIAQLARLLRMRDQQAQIESVLKEFFLLTPDGWMNGRCDLEIAAYQDRSSKAKKSAQASVAVRREKSGLSNSQIRSARMSAAREKGRHTDAEWQALKTFCGMKCVRCGAEGHLDKDHILPVYQGGSDGIDNLQPMCAKCNSSKGPEDVDFRPNGWKAFVERSLSGGSTNQEPRTKNQTPKEENPPTPRKRGERLSDSWEPGDEGRSFALTLGISGERFNSEAARFCDYWSSQPGMKGVKTDWPATWRNWCRNAAERAPPGRTDRPPDRKSVQLQTAALMTGTHRNTVEIIDDSETVIARRLG